jgi:glycine/D-amino acid oxidase-like deaminating enzyme
LDRSVKPELPFDEMGAWSRVPADLKAALVDDLQADVVVIGGGCTGLSTALQLRAEGADVVVLEEDFAGCGASGRNTGVVTGAIVQDLSLTRRLLGAELTAARAGFADAAVKYLEEVIELHGVECDYTPSGTLLVNVHPAQEAELSKKGEIAREYGSPVRFLSSGEMRERKLPPAFLSGVLEEQGGTLDPGKYMSGLRTAALEAGVRLFERTRVVELTDGPRVTVKTDGGRVSADYAVLGTNAYTPALGRLGRMVIPIRVSLFETDPLGREPREQLGWRGREPVNTAHGVVETYLLSARDTLVGGVKVAGYPWRSRLAAAHDPSACRAIHRSFRERLPELGEVGVARFWSGWTAFTTDFNPVFGVEGRHDNILYGLGYAGHGLSQGTLMGAVLAERVLGREHRLEAAVRRRVRRWPPEPFRWVGAKLLISRLMAADRRIDRKIRRASG